MVFLVFLIFANNDLKEDQGEKQFEYFGTKWNLTKTNTSTSAHISNIYIHVYKQNLTAMSTYICIISLGE